MLQIVHYGFPFDAHPRFMRILLLIITCFLFAQTPLLAQQNKKAEQIIADYLRVSGGYDYVDSVFSGMYQKFHYLQYQNYSHQFLPAPREREVVYQLNSDGQYRSTERDIPTGERKVSALSHKEAWDVRNGMFYQRDSSYYFEALWRSFEQNPCLIAPITYSSHCSRKSFGWERVDSLGSTLVDVLVDEDNREYWFAQDTHLLVKTIADKGRLVYIKEDYRQVSGVWFPYRETGYYNDDLASITTYDSIAFVPAWPDFIFMPPIEAGK